MVWRQRPWTQFDEPQDDFNGWRRVRYGRGRPPGPRANTANDRYDWRRAERPARVHWLDDGYGGEPPPARRARRPDGRNPPARVRASHQPGGQFDYPDPARPSDARGRKRSRPMPQPPPQQRPAPARQRPQSTTPNFTQKVRCLYKLIKVSHHLTNVAAQQLPGMFQKMTKMLTETIKPAAPNNKTALLIEGNAKNWSFTTIIILRDHYQQAADNVLFEFMNMGAGDWKQPFAVATAWARRNLGHRLRQSTVESVEALVTAHLPTDWSNAGVNHIQVGPPQTSPTPTWATVVANGADSPPREQRQSRSTRPCTVQAEIHPPPPSTVLRTPPQTALSTTVRLPGEPGPTHPPGALTPTWPSGAESEEGQLHSGTASSGDLENVVPPTPSPHRPPPPPSSGQPSPEYPSSLSLSLLSSSPSSMSISFPRLETTAQRQRTSQRDSPRATPTPPPGDIPHDAHTQVQQDPPRPTPLSNGSVAFVEDLIDLSGSEPNTTPQAASKVSKLLDQTVTVSLGPISTSVGIRRTESTQLTPTTPLTPRLKPTLTYSLNSGNRPRNCRVNIKGKCAYKNIWNVSRRLILC